VVDAAGDEAAVPGAVPAALAAFRAGIVPLLAGTQPADA
jgi:hypothetical protein